MFREDQADNFIIWAVWSVPTMTTGYWGRHIQSAVTSPVTPSPCILGVKEISTLCMKKPHGWKPVSDMRSEVEEEALPSYLILGGAS